MEESANSVEDESDDEVIDASCLEGLEGSRVRIQRDGADGCLGTVRSVSPGGSRMLVCFDADACEQWVGADDAWGLDTSDNAAEESTFAAAVEAADEAAQVDVESAPVIENWKWMSDGALCGYVYGKAGFREGELMTTSTVPPEGRFEYHVVCCSDGVFCCFCHCRYCRRRRRRRRRRHRSSRPNSRARAHHALLHR